jgi:hypothetical protein
MRFTPKSKEELDKMDAYSLLKPGTYNFNVIDAVEQQSRSGNDMIKLTLEVYDDLGNTRNIFDYILEAMATKLHSFCVAIGAEHHYTNGTLRQSDCINKSGKLELVIQQGKDKPDGGVYPDANSVKRYLTKDTKVTKSSPEPVTFDDDVPF